MLVVGGVLEVTWGGYRCVGVVREVVDKSMVGLADVRVEGVRCGGEVPKSMSKSEGYS